MIRTLHAETLRYGHYSVAGEYGLRPPVPVGQQAHRSRSCTAWAASTATNGIVCTSINPRDLVPESNMPSYPWLETATVDGKRRSPPNMTDAAHAWAFRTPMRRSPRRRRPCSHRQERPRRAGRVPPGARHQNVKLTRKHRWHVNDLRQCGDPEPAIVTVPGARSALVCAAPAARASSRRRHTARASRPTGRPRRCVRAPCRRRNATASTQGMKGARP